MTPRPVPAELTMQPVFDHHQLQTRRRFFGRSAVGIGTAALATLLNRESVADQLVSHFAPTAKRVIYLFQKNPLEKYFPFPYIPTLIAINRMQLLRCLNPCE